MSRDRTMSVAFRVDASLDIGTGHVMRCLTLADALSLKGVACRFICRTHPGHLIEHIRGKGYRVDALSAGSNPHVDGDADSLPAHAGWLACSWQADATQTCAVLAHEPPHWLVLDHYALDARWENALRGCYRKLMVIDDLADRPHICDLLVDQNLGREAIDYDGLVPAHCTRLVGPQYALLRPEFAVLRPYSLQRRRVPRLGRLLISMGGVDQPNATGKVLQALKNCPLPADCQITVVMGSHAQWLQEIRALATTMSWPTEVRVNVTDMAKLMADSDLAIGAAGSTSWERCCLGLPSVLVVLARNQLEIARALAKKGGGIPD